MLLREGKFLKFGAKSPKVQTERTRGAQVSSRETRTLNLRANTESVHPGQCRKKSQEFPGRSFAPEGWEGGSSAALPGNGFCGMVRTWANDVRRASALFSFYFSTI